MGRSLSFKNLTGGLNVENDIGTINQSTRKTESPDLMNVEYYGLGGIRTMDGNVQFGNTQTGKTIVGGWDYVKGDDHHMMITLNDGSVKRYNPSTKQFDLIFTFESGATRCSYVNMNNGVVITNGVDDLLFYENGRHTLLTGQVNVTNGSDTVTGTSTIFSTQLSIGDYIEIDGCTGKYKVTEISSATSLKVDPDIVITDGSSSLTDCDYYLSDISECNAKLTNEDDPSIDEDIRGLAINYYQGRLFIGTDEGYLFYSELGSYNKFDIKYGGGVIRNLYNDTSAITALGLYSSYMIIHKGYSSYTLDGKSDEPENWELSPYSNITCKSQQSFTVFGRTYYVYSDDNMGIYPLTTQTIYGDKYVGEVISERINNGFQNLKSWETDKIFIVRLPQRRQVAYYMPFKSESSSNIAIIYDIHTKTWLRRRVPQSVSIAFEYDNEVYIGTTDGKVLREFYGNSFDGSPIVAYWRSPWFDFGDTSHFKSFKELSLFMVEEYTCNFKIRVRKDIQEDFVERSIGSDIYDVDALVWDDGVSGNTNLTYWDLNYWVKTGINVKRFPTEKQFFYNYQIEFTTENVPISSGVQGFALYGFDIQNVQYEENPWT